MAHNFKVVVRPHKNKDGSDSKTKRDYIITDRTRKRVVEVGVESSKKAVGERIDQERAAAIMLHMLKHPTDMAFRRKHKL